MSANPIHLICVGFGKSGTTLIDHCIRYATNFRVAKGLKELDYFQREITSADDYMNLFDEEGRAGESENVKVFFESSPTYVTGKNPDAVFHLFEKMVHNLSNVKILFCLRKPVRRAFSHYIHDMQAFARFGRDRYWEVEDWLPYLLQNPYTLDFEQALFLNANVGCNYTPSISIAFDMFGSSNVEFFIAERDGINLENFLNRLNNFLGLDVKQLSDESRVAMRSPIFEGSALPAYYFGVKEYRQKYNLLYQEMLEPDQIFISVAGKSVLLEGVPKSRVERMVHAAARWTHSVEADQMNAYSRIFFNDDIKELQILLSSVSRDNTADEISLYLSGESEDRIVGRSSFSVEILKVARYGRSNVF